MGSTNAYACDGPKCGELTTRVPNHRYPEQWLRVTLSAPDSDAKKTGAFHAEACAHAWIDEQLGIEDVNSERYKDAARAATGDLLKTPGGA